MSWTTILKHYKTFLLSFFFLLLFFIGIWGFHRPLYRRNKVLELQVDSLRNINHTIDSIHIKIIRDTIIKTVYKREIQRRVEYIERPDVGLSQVREEFKKLNYE